jgi:hypothetical protein
MIIDITLAIPKIIPTFAYSLIETVQKTEIQRKPNVG